MMRRRRRLAFAFLAVPAALYIYACSSDTSEVSTPPTENDGGNVDGSTHVTNDGSTTADASNDDGSTTNPDAGDAGPDGAAVCHGNPLADSGNATFPDGGITLNQTTLSNILLTTNAFYDGPQYVDAFGGSLIFSDVYNATIKRIPAAGGGTTDVRVSEDQGNAFRPGGNALKGGMLLTAMWKGSAPAGPLQQIYVTPLDGGANGTSLDAGGARQPNDLAVGPLGDIYLSDPAYLNAGTTGVYRISPTGVWSAIETFPATFDEANGIALSPDNRTLYVTFTNAQYVKSYPVAADGSVAAGTVLLQSSDLADHPDGMAVDAQGNLWITEAAASAKSGHVEIFSPTKQRLGQITFDTQRPVGVAFGGADNKTLYIVTEEGIYVYHARCAGIR